MPSLRRKAATASLLFSGSTFIATVLSFLTNLILILGLGTYEYGLLVLALSFYAILSVFTDLGTSNLVSAEMAREIGSGNVRKAAGIVRGFRRFTLLVSLGTAAVCAAAWPVVSAFSGAPIANFLAVVGLYVLFSGIREILSAVFYGVSDFSRYGTIGIAESLIRFALVAVFILFLHEGVLVALAAYAAATLLSAAAYYPSYRRTVLVFADEPEPAAFRRILRAHGKWSVFTIFFKKIGDQVHYWAVERALGVEAVAIVAVAFRGVGLIAEVVRSLEAVLLPIASGLSATWDRMMLVVNRSMKYAAWLSVLLFIPAFLLADWGIPLVFSARYAGTALVFKIMLLSLLPGSVAVVFRPLLFALKAQRELFFQYFLIVPIGLFEYALASWYGLTGFAAGFLIASFVSTWVRYRIIQHVKPGLRLDFRGIFRFDAYDRQQLATVREKISRKPQQGHPPPASRMRQDRNKRQKLRPGKPGSTTPVNMKNRQKSRR